MTRRPKPRRGAAAKWHRESPLPAAEIRAASEAGAADDEIAERFHADRALPRHEDPLATHFLALLMAAEEWRDQMVSSNRPYPEDDPDGQKTWAGVDNANGHLVQAVDAIRALPRVLLREEVPADPVLRAAELASRALDLTAGACVLKPEDGQERVVQVARTAHRAVTLWRTMLSRAEATLGPLRDAAQERCPHIGRRPTHCPTCGKSF